MEKLKIQDTIYTAIEDLNKILPDSNQLDKSNDTMLYGQEGKLDSLGLVNFIVAVEQKIEQKFNKSVTLADEKAMSQKNSPFKSVSTLIDYVSVLLREN